MRFHFTLLIFILAASLTSCKKKSNSTPAPAAIADSRFIYGVLDVVIDVVKFDDTDYRFDSSALATFYADSGTPSTTYAGIITLNSDTVQWILDGYHPQLIPHFNPNLNWSIQGTINIPPISTSFTGDFPVYIGTYPDTILSLNGVTLEINASNVLNADSVVVGFYSGNYSYSKTFSASAGLINFSPSDLNTGSNRTLTFLGNGPGYLRIICIKYDNVIIENKLYQFRKIKSIMTPAYFL